MPKRNPQAERDVATLEKVKVAQPRLYEVVHHDSATANEIMLNVHTKGSGVAGVYPRDMAETKAKQVVTFARQHEMPLECSVRRQSC
jgi:ATP-dependent Clp protease adapter protein ClpS